MTTLAEKQKLWETAGFNTMVEEYQATVEDAQSQPVPSVEGTRRYYRRYAMRQAAVPDNGDKLACSKGCSYCCHTRVSAPAQEVLVLADAIERMPERTRAAIRERIEANAKRVDGMDTATHMRTTMACPLLDAQGACSAYEDRPSNCRRYHSLSLKDCEDSFGHPKDLQSKIRLSTPLLVINVSQYLGHRKVLVEHGVDTAYYELNTGLREALADPDACRERLAAGQPGLRDAVVCVRNGEMI